MPWPASDSFNDGSPASDTVGLVTWIRYIPWTTDSSSGFGTRMLPFETDAYLYTGWFTSGGGSSGSGSPSSRPLVATTNNPPDGDSRPAAFVYRDYTTQDGCVEISFNEVADGAAHAAITQRNLYVGVGFRLQGGSVTDGNTLATHRITGASGYWAFLGLSDDLTLFKWSLVRSDGTTATEIDFGTTAVASLGLNKSRKMRCRFRNESGNPRMVIETQGTFFDVDSSWSVVVDHTDTNGAKITTTGRVGLLLSPEVRESDGVMRAVLVNYLSIKNFDATTQSWIERARRTLPTGGVSVAGSIGSAGNSLQSAWFSDLYSVTSGLEPIRKDSTNGRILFDPGGGGTATGFYTSQRQADSPNQDRSAIFQFGSTGTASERKAGIALRVNQSTVGVDPEECYYAWIARDDVGATATIELWRKKTTHRRMAYASATINQTTNYTFRLVVTNTAEPTVYPELKVYLDGVQVILVKDSTTFPSGLIVDASGTVTDNTSAGILSGVGEGLVMELPDSGTRTVTVDAWAQGAGAITGTVAEQNQLSISVGAETDGSTGTLTVPIDWDVEVTRSGARLQHELEHGYVYRGVVRNFRRRVWTVRSSAATETEVDTLTAFFESHRGPEVPFGWVTPEGDTVTVHFREDFLATRLRAPGVYDFEFSLEELTDGA